MDELFHLRLDAQALVALLGLVGAAFASETGLFAVFVVLLVGPVGGCFGVGSLAEFVVASAHFVLDDGVERGDN